MPIKEECKGCEHATALGTCEAYGPCIREGTHAPKPMPVNAPPAYVEPPHRELKVVRIPSWGVRKPQPTIGPVRKVKPKKSKTKAAPIPQGGSELMTHLQDALRAQRKAKADVQHRNQLWHAYRKRRNRNPDLTWHDFLEQSGRLDLFE